MLDFVTRTLQHRAAERAEGKAMSPGTIIAGGVGLVRREPKTIAIWTALYLVIAVLTILAMHPFLASVAMLQRQVVADAAMGTQTVTPLHQGIFALVALIELVFLVLGLIAFAAVVRAAKRPGGDRFAYLRLGMDELRLFGLGVLVVVAAIAAEIVAVLIVALVAVLVKVVIGDTAAIVVAIISGIALTGAAIWVEVRMSLAGALTVLRGRFVIADAWRATRGRFWTLFGAYVLLGIVFAIIGIVMIAISNPGLFAAYARFDQQAMASAAAEQLARQAAGVSPLLIVQMVVGAIVTTMMGAVAVGSIATAAIALDGGKIAGASDQSI